MIVGKTEFKQVPPIDITDEEMEAIRQAEASWKAISDAVEGLHAGVAKLKAGPHPILGYNVERTLRAHKLLDKEQPKFYAQNAGTFLKEVEMQREVLLGMKPEELRPEQAEVLKRIQAKQA